MGKLTPICAAIRGGQLYDLTGGVSAYALKLPLLTDRYGFGENATLDRNSGSTIQDYLGNTVVILANEFGFSGARRVDHADGIDYGAGALGIQYFDTEPDGTPLTTLKGLQIWEGSTNEFYDSANPATQNITTTAQSYTVSIKGTGDITLTGTATGTATEASPLTVTATAGTLTCTVNGTVTEPQVEAKAYKTLYIPTPVGASATRLADNCQVPWVTGLVNDFVLGCEAVLNPTVGYAGHLTVYNNGANLVGFSRLSSSGTIRAQTGIAGSYYTLSMSAAYNGSSYKVQLRNSSTQGKDMWLDEIKGVGNANTDALTDTTYSIQIGRNAIFYHNGNIKNINLRTGNLSDSEVTG